METRTLPTGDVTFLFSDLEGSTRLVQQIGPDVYRGVLEQHQRIVRSALAGHDGFERGTEGDSFFAVFAAAPAALSAAVDTQLGLAQATWPDGVRVGVRMGIHTGLGIPGGDDYVGVDVNRAARIAAAAHGGQVLLSNATRTLVAENLPDGVRLLSLGSYRLRDLPGEERLHQLEIRGLPSAFPPLRAVDVRRAHLPPDATSFIGREAELVTLARLLANHRLVTLTGPGGSGKTRLALRAAAEVAERYADGTFFVPLATITDASLLPAAIASILNLPQEPGSAEAATLSAWLRERELLLVLDNLEQVDEAGRALGELLAVADGLRLLVTSRAPLRVAGEQEDPVAPLPTPDPQMPAPVLERSDAVRLFVDRARLLRPDFTPTPDDLRHIAEIVARIDGLPLAIELAAARTRLLSLGAILERLGRRLDVLVSGPTDAPLRQRSLREAIAWSYALLDEADRVLFRQLAVFVGGWTFEAAEAIAGGPPLMNTAVGLETLVDQALIQAAPTGTEVRFTMLPTIGEFAAEQLAGTSEGDAIKDRHAAYYRRLAEDAQAASESPEAASWFDRIEADLDNIRAAIEWSEARGTVATSLAIAAALGPFWLQRNHSAEGQQILVGLVERASAQEVPEVGSAALAGAVNATWLGDYATGRRLGEVAAARFRRAGDRRRLSTAMSTVGFSTIERDPSAALALIEQNLELSRELGDVREEGQACLAQATAQFALGRLADARASLARSIELSRRAGNWFFALNASVFDSRIKILMGDIDGGITGYREVLETSRTLDLRLGIAIALEYLAEVAVWAGDVPRAVRLGAVAGRIKEQLGGGIPPGIGGGLDPLAVGRERLSSENFERETAAGRAMDLDTAVDEARAIEPPATIPAQGAPLARHSARS